jgi:hypothetical protein
MATDQQREYKRRQFQKLQKYCTEAAIDTASSLSPKVIEQKIEYVTEIPNNKPHVLSPNRSVAPIVIIDDTKSSIVIEDKDELAEELLILLKIFRLESLYEQLMLFDACTLDKVGQFKHRDVYELQLNNSREQERLLLMIQLIRQHKIIHEGKLELTKLFREAKNIMKCT